VSTTFFHVNVLQANVRSYYQQFEEQQTQSLIDQRIKEHLGQAAAFQVGAPFTQHMMQFPGARPRLPILPTPMIPHGYMQQPGGPFAGVRPPILQAPTGSQGKHQYCFHFLLCISYKTFRLNCTVHNFCNLRSCSVNSIRPLSPNRWRIN
jgi:hypothetical protein